MDTIGIKNSPFQLGFCRRRDGCIKVRQIGLPGGTNCDRLYGSRGAEGTIVRKITITEAQFGFPPSAGRRSIAEIRGSIARSDCLVPSSPVRKRYIRLSSDASGGRQRLAGRLTEELRMQVVASLRLWLVFFDGNPVGVGICVLANTRD